MAQLSQIATLKINGQTVREPGTNYILKSTQEQVYVQRVYHHAGEKYVEAMVGGRMMNLRRSSIRVAK